jgi:hypothetical protein
LKNEVNNLIAASNDEIAKEVRQRYRNELNDIEKAINVSPEDSAARINAINRLEVLSKEISLDAKEHLEVTVEILMNQTVKLLKSSEDKAHSDILNDAIEVIEKIAERIDALKGNVAENDIRSVLEEELSEVADEITKISREQMTKVAKVSVSPEPLAVSASEVKIKKEPEKPIGVNSVSVEENQSNRVDKKQERIIAIQEKRKNDRDALLVEMKKMQNSSKTYNDSDLLQLIDKRDNLLEKSRKVTRDEFYKQFQVAFKELSGGISTHDFKEKIINLNANKPESAQVMPQTDHLASSHNSKWTPLERFTLLLNSTIELYRQISSLLDKQLSAEKRTEYSQMEERLKVFQQKVMSDNPPSNDELAKKLKELRVIHPILTTKLRALSESQKKEDAQEIKHPSARK